MRYVLFREVDIRTGVSSLEEVINNIIKEEEEKCSLFVNFKQTIKNDGRILIGLTFENNEILKTSNKKIALKE